MSAITPISNEIKKNYNNASNLIPYSDLIDYCSIRKQFSRIIPNYYQNIQSNNIHQYKNFTSEEYNKLKAEIISIEQSITDLKAKKQKKLEQIEELRALMRKEGAPKIIINKRNIIKNNYYNRERNYKQTFKGNNRQRNGNCKVSSDEGEEICSNWPAMPGLSSGKDDEVGCEDSYQHDNTSRFYNNSNNNSIPLHCSNKEKNLENSIHKQIQEEGLLLKFEN